MLPPPPPVINPFAASPMSCDDDLVTPIHFASALGHTEILKKFLTVKKANPNVHGAHAG